VEPPILLLTSDDPSLLRLGTNEHVFPLVRSRLVGLPGLEPGTSSLSGIEGSALCGPAFSQVTAERQGPRDAFLQPRPDRRLGVAKCKLGDQPVAGKVMGCRVGAAAPSGGVAMSLVRRPAQPAPCGVPAWWSSRPAPSPRRSQPGYPLGSAGRTGTFTGWRQDLPTCASVGGHRLSWSIPGCWLIRASPKVCARPGNFSPVCKRPRTTVAKPEGTTRPDLADHRACAAGRGAVASKALR
jgi:hypothetical protein